MHVMIRADEIKGGIANNEILRELIKFVHQGWPERVANELKPNFNVRNKLSICNGCLMRLDCVVFPGSLRGRLLDLVHEGHPGVMRTLQRVRETAWWPGVSAQVRVKVPN